MKTNVLVVAGVAVLALGMGACASGDGDGSRTAGGPTGSAPGTTVVRPDGPTPTVAGPLTAGRGISLGAAGGGSALADRGFVEDEYTISGTATSYRSDGELPADGRYELRPDAEAPYATRIVVRRPRDAARFNGTVVIEWLNVSGGVDAAANYTYVAEEVLRNGYAWVGLSAQRIGIEGGTVAVRAPGAERSGAGKGLKAIDPDRYGSLAHPGDAFSYDMFTQAARVLRTPGDVDPLGGLVPERILGVGESQSALTLTTYANGVQPLAHQFDGFLVHSRAGAAAPLGAPGAGIDIAGSLGGKPTTFRTDLDVPVIVVQTETDVLGVMGFLPARQDDTDRLRLWEVAGTAHADRFQLGPLEAGLGCVEPINAGQQVFVLRAALAGLDRWVRDGTAPPRAPRLSVDTSGPSPAFVRDEVGNVQGGIRPPIVEAPVDVLSGLPGSSPSVVCLLMGTTTPIPPDRLVTLHGSRDGYLAAYTEATDELIEAGFALAADRDEILADAAPARVG